MKNYSDLKDKHSNSPILEALNRGNQSGVSSFGSVDQFIQGLLGPNFIKEKEAKQEAPQYQEEIVKKQEPNNYKKEESIITKLSDMNLPAEEETEEEPEYTESSESSEDAGNSYKIYKDKEEVFECNISIQGAKLSNAQVRLILDHEVCNLVFYGKINKDGKCFVPLKKMNFYPEGSTGRIKLEVIVDDTVFMPWEETFVVEGAKKVTVQIKPQKKINFSF